MNKLSAMLLAAGLLFVPACGGGVAGTYVLDKAEFRRAMAKANRASLAETIVADVSGTIELKSDGTMSLSLTLPPAPTISKTGTWKLDGDALTLIEVSNGKEDRKTPKYAAGVITYDEQDIGDTKVGYVFRKK